MSKILNEYSPINPRNLATQPTYENDEVVNSILPSRKTINIRGLWEGSVPIPIINKDMSISNITATYGSANQWRTIYTEHLSYYNGENGHPLSPFVDPTNPNVADFPEGYYHLHIDKVYGGTAPKLSFCRTQGYEHFLRAEDRNNISSFDTSTQNGISISTGSSENDAVQYDEIIYISLIRQDGTLINKGWRSIIFQPSSGTTTFEGITLDYIPTSGYVNKAIHWTPNSSVMIPSPVPTVKSTISTRRFISPETGFGVDSFSDVSLRGFAYKSTVENWVNSQTFEEYYPLLDSEVGWIHYVKANIENENNEFELDRYLEAEDFPYDVLFECSVDISVKTSNGQQYIEFDSSAGFEEQDIFAIYERRKIDYRFYYDADNGGGLYATLSVPYGDYVGNPQKGDNGNQLPQNDEVRYKLESSTVNGITTWSAVEYNPAEGESGLFAAKKRELSSSRSWRKKMNISSVASWDNMQTTDKYFNYKGKNQYYNMRTFSSQPSGYYRLRIDNIYDSLSTEEGQEKYITFAPNNSISSSTFNITVLRNAKTDMIFQIANSWTNMTFWGNVSTGNDAVTTTFQNVKFEYLGTTNPDELIEDMRSHISRPDDADGYEYEMNMTTTIPVICIVDGEIQTDNSGYKNSSNYSCDFGGMYGLTDFRSIELGQTFNCDLSSYKIFRKQNGIVLDIPGRDTSFMNQIGGWFTNADCIHDWHDKNTVWNITEPLILYQKTTEVSTLEFDINSGNDYTFAQSLTTMNTNYTPVTYTYYIAGSSTASSYTLSSGNSSLKLPEIYNGNIIAAPNGTVLKIRRSNFYYYHVDGNSNIIEKALVWKSGNNNIITMPTDDSVVNLTVSNSITLTPVMGNIDKPKIYINCAEGFSLKSKTTGVTPSATDINGAPQDFTVDSLTYRARTTGENIYEIVCLSANMRSDFYADNYSLSWIDVADNNAQEDFGGFAKDETAFDINTGNISLKLGETATLTMLTSKQLTVSVNNLNFFRKNNSPSNPVHDETNYTIKVYMDDSSTPTSKTYTKSGTTDSIQVSGTKITRVDAFENKNGGVSPNLARFKGLSTDVSGTNMISLPYALTADTTLYVQWEPYSYILNVQYDNLSTSYFSNPRTLLTTPVEYNPIDGTGLALNIYSALRTLTTRYKIRVTYPYADTTRDADFDLYTAIFDDASSVTYKIGSSNLFNEVNMSELASISCDYIRRYGNITDQECTATLKYYINISESSLRQIIENRNMTNGEVSYLASSNGGNYYMYLTTQSTNPITRDGAEIISFRTKMSIGDYSNNTDYYVFNLYLEQNQRQ